MLKPWREVIQPHADVLEGRFDESEFAADLTRVQNGTARPEYQDPARFFERTVITEGMGLLLLSVVKRLAGNGGDPVVQLQTAFGGGKTHTMMAVLHVATASSAQHLRGIAPLLDRANVKELRPARVAVLDGNALGPAQPRQHGSIVAATMWGELAWQLGGEAGYAFVAESDKSGTSPGKEVLARLLESVGPAVILIDETVAYLRQLEPGKTYAGGTYNSNLSFLQALTEAVSSVRQAMLLASLPQSQLEVGDEHGKQALDACQKIFGRIEAVWKPVGTEEAFEIVRRRLFKTDLDEVARDEVCRAFADFYVHNGDKFPAEVRDGAYLRRLTASYPIHPEVFERLYEDWSTLPKFQRTRGVLRLMARLIHTLWTNNDRDLLILPGSIPLDDSGVRTELIKYLPTQGWEAIVDKDIDGAHAAPRAIDGRIPTLGAIQAARRAARTIFLASAPSVASQHVRGIGVERVRLGCAQPDQSPARYDDALKRLTDELHYLYSGNDRFWFDTRTNLRREMEDRMHRYDARLHLFPEIEKRLQKLVKVPMFDGVHLFASSGDVPDKTELRLVVLDPEQSHRRKDTQSQAVKAAQAIVTKHGDKPREHQNRLLFLAADATAVGPLKDHVRRWLAWSSIVKEAAALNLDTHGRNEAERSLEEAAARVEGSLREAYKLMLCPMQDVDDGTPGAVHWEDDTLNIVAAGSYDKAIATTTREREWVIGAWAPTHLAGVLSRWFWKPESQGIGALKVWKDTCKYLYLPRLASQEVFIQTIRDGVEHRDFFAFAAGTEKDAKRFTGLLFGRTGGVYLDDSALLVTPDIAAAAVAEEEAAAQAAATATTTTTRRPTPPSVPGVGSVSSMKKVATSNGPPPMPRRFHGTAEVAAKDPHTSFAALVDNVIQHFTATYGTSVRITVDIEARSPDGFDMKLQRTVKENATTLKFKTADFEED